MPKENHEGIANVSYGNCAISSVESELTLFCVEVGRREHEFASPLTTSNRAAIESHALGENCKIVELKIPSVAPPTLLAKHGFEQVHIIQIDTEGMDFEILKSFDLVAIAPEIIPYKAGRTGGILPPPFGEGVPSDHLSWRHTGDSRAIGRRTHSFREKQPNY